MTKVPLARAAVERRKASCLLTEAEPHPLGAEVVKQRLPAFRFLSFVAWLSDSSDEAPKGAKAEAKPRRKVPDFTSFNPGYSETKGRAETKPPHSLGAGILKVLMGRSGAKFATENGRGLFSPSPGGGGSPAVARVSKRRRGGVG